MMETRQIELRKAALHIWGDGSLPVLARGPMHLDDTVRQLATRYITRMLEDTALKRGILSDASPMLLALRSLSDDFVDAGAGLARTMGEIAAQTDAPVPFDVLTLALRIDGEPAFAVLKLNYKQGCVHQVTPEGGDIRIIPYHGLLPSAGQRIEVGLIFYPDANACQLVDKLCTLDGEKIGFLRVLLGDFVPEPSMKESISMAREIAEQVVEETGGQPDYDTATRVQEAIHSSLETTGALDMTALAQVIFPEEPMRQEHFARAVEETGMLAPIPMASPRLEATLSKLKFKTDIGIELSIPMELYRDPDVVQVTNNPDGSISISLKGIGELRKLG